MNLRFLLSLLAALVVAGLRAQALEPSIKVFPADAKPPEAISFPRLYGYDKTPREYVLKVAAPTAKLTIEILGSIMGEIQDRTCVIDDPSGKELKKLEFKTGAQVRIELADLKPGIYEVSIPEGGVEQVSITGGNVFAAVRAFNHAGGINVHAPSSDAKAGTRLYYLVPPNTASFRVNLLYGLVSLGIVSGEPFLTEFVGRRTKVTKLAAAAPLEERERQVNQIPAWEPREISFTGAATPRIGYVEWLPYREEVGNGGESSWMVIDGAELYSPDPSYVLYETLEK